MDYLLQEEHFSVRKAEVSDAALIAEIKQRYEAPLKEIFPCSLT